MKEYIVTKNDTGQRLDRFCGKICPRLPSSLLQKYFRTKDIKVNGHWQKGDFRLQEGDRVRLYLPDDLFTEKKSSHNALESIRPKLDIVYEDENILLVNKPQGVLCHNSGVWDGNSLIDHIQAYVYQKKEWNPQSENAFAPALCNRIDRGTGGIVIAAKNAATLRVINEKIKSREIDKRYLCICLGRPKPPQGELKGYLYKDSDKNTVHVHSEQTEDSILAITRYELLKSSNGLSLVECALLTGRTHQIRAQMSDFGHPLLGDSKYGIEKQNRLYHENRQLLWSYKICFSFTSDAEHLNYLQDKTFQVQKVPFLDKYFPSQS